MSKIIEFIQVNKGKAKYLLYVVLGLICIWALIQIFTPKTTMDVKSKQKIDSLTHSTELYKDSLERERLKTVYYETELKAINDSLSLNNEQIKSINKIVHEKIPVINNYSNDDITKYFIKRYGTN